MMVYLVPIGRRRFELYSEPPDDPSPPPEDRGRLRRWAHQASTRWRELVDAASLDQSTGRFGRWRDRLVRHLAEGIAEQRTLWALGRGDEATLLVPTTLDEGSARSALNCLLEVARRKHGWWMGVDLPLLVVSGILAPVPGPNALAYYLAYRVVGHFLSWRGARRASSRIRWSFQPDQRLAELELLLTVPRAARASRLDAIAAELNLQRLSAFFERVVA